MRATGQSYSEKVSRWEIAVVQLTDETSLPAHEAEQLAQLKTLLLDAREIGVRHEGVRSQMRELGTQMRDLVKRGEKIRNRLGASLRGRLGFQADALVRFGFSPLPLVRRPREKKQKPVLVPAVPTQP